MQIMIKNRRCERTKMIVLKYKLSFMRNIFCFFAALIFSVNAFCHPADSTVKIKIYHVNYPVTGVIIGGLMIPDYFAISRIKGKKAISDEELAFLNTEEQKDLINPIDRWALRLKVSDRKLYQQISDYTIISSILLPCLLTFNKTIRKDWFDLLLMYTEGHIITFTFYNYSFFGPTFQNRYRPLTYYSEIPDNERKEGGNRNSFYSGHVASCAYSTFFMAKVYCDYHPNIGAAKYIWYAAATIPPMFLGYSRLKGLKHFPSDNLVGFALGAVIGIVVPELHKNPKNKDISLGMFTSPDGMGLSIRWKLPDQHFFASSK